jgi:hypothetical protein
LGLLLLLVVACSADTTGRPEHSPSPEVARVSVSPAGSRPAIAVTSLVPMPGDGPWIGSTVLIDYTRLTGDVVLGRARLWIDDRTRPARVTWTAITPISFVVIFSWGDPYAPGAHRFRVELGTTGGGTVAAEWEARTRRP